MSGAQRWELSMQVAVHRAGMDFFVKKQRAVWRTEGPAKIPAFLIFSIFTQELRETGRRQFGFKSLKPREGHGFHRGGLAQISPWKSAGDGAKRRLNFGRGNCARSKKSVPHSNFPA
ncbi:hypothetical protein Poly51_14790 [Rubripirellula tenax]|uniref:Uncharacterized protein n=1 Tax=Rubripirellula tenax TaxID=2528015 RepID=A0A5C6FDM8_9BACT|nr:hypothetical protein Poly51_14790 [Rubripirellula tenax]